MILQTIWATLYTTAMIIVVCQSDDWVAVVFSSVFMLPLLIVTWLPVFGKDGDDRWSSRNP